MFPKPTNPVESNNIWYYIQQKRVCEKGARAALKIGKLCQTEIVTSSEKYIEFYNNFFYCKVL